MHNTLLVSKPVLSVSKQRVQVAFGSVERDRQHVIIFDLNTSGSILAAKQGDNNATLRTRVRRAG